MKYTFNIFLIYAKYCCYKINKKCLKQLKISNINILMLFCFSGAFLKIFLFVGKNIYILIKNWIFTVNVYKNDCRHV